MGGADLTGAGSRRNISNLGGTAPTSSTGGGVARTRGIAGGCAATSSILGGTARTSAIGGNGLPGNIVGLPTSARNRHGEGMVRSGMQEGSQDSAHLAQ